VTPYFYPAEAFGGPVKVAFDVGRELVRRGHEVVVFTSDAKDLNNRIDAGSNEIEGIKVYYFRNLSMSLVKWSKLFITPGLPKMMTAHLKSFDVVHVHEYTTYQNIVVHNLAKKFGVPYVLQAHGSLPKIGRTSRKKVYNALFGNALLRDASKVIALGEIEADQYKSAGVPVERIAIVPNGIDLSEYSNLPSKGSFKKKFGLPENKKIVLYLGRIHETKRVDLLVEAYAQLIKEMGVKDSVLVIAGPDDGFLNKAKSMAQSLGVSSSICFAGFISKEDKLKALVDAYVFVTPSFYGFPMTFLEACAVGVPIIVTNFGDSLDWIDQKAGYEVPPTKSDLAVAINRIISNYKLQNDYSRNCREIVRSEFSLKQVVDKLERIYSEITKNKCNNNLKWGD